RGGDPRRLHVLDPRGGAAARRRHRTRVLAAATGQPAPPRRAASAAAPGRALTVAVPSSGQPSPEPVAGSPPFPSYEEFASDLLEAIDRAGLSIEDVRHHVEPGLGERRFECTFALPAARPPRTHVHLSFRWNALLPSI